MKDCGACFQAANVTAESVLHYYTLKSIQGLLKSYNGHVATIN